VAWEHGKPSPWWTLRGTATVIGEHELRSARWQQRPAQMLATPADFVAAAGAGFCVIDWSADINSLIGDVAAVECAAPPLAERLRTTPIAQAMPNIRISVSAPSIRRAA